MVEARNGHFKNLFKLLNNTIPTAHVPNLGDFYQLGAAIINAYHEPLLMEGATVEQAVLIRNRRNLPNLVRLFVYSSFVVVPSLRNNMSPTL